MSDEKTRVPLVAVGKGETKEYAAMRAWGCCGPTLSYETGRIVVAIQLASATLLTLLTMVVMVACYLGWDPRSPAIAQHHCLFTEVQMVAETLRVPAVADALAAYGLARWQPYVALPLNVTQYTLALRLNIVDDPRQAYIPLGAYTDWVLADRVRGSMEVLYRGVTTQCFLWNDNVSTLQLRTDGRDEDYVSILLAPAFALYLFWFVGVLSLVLIIISQDLHRNAHAGPDGIYRIAHHYDPYILLFSVFVLNGFAAAVLVVALLSPVAAPPSLVLA